MNSFRDANGLYENRLWALLYDQYNNTIRRHWHEQEWMFYSRRLATCEGRVLEVACGTGMLLLPILEEGRDIHGFDLSAEMLQILFRKAEAKGIQDIRERVTQQDMLDFHYEQPFDAIFIPANSLMLLTTQEEQIQCLKNIYAHLKPGGQLLLNLFMPVPEQLLACSGSPGEVMDFSEDEATDFFELTHPETGQDVDVFCKKVYNIAEQMRYDLWKLVVEEQEYVVSMRSRWIYKEEFQLLLRLGGFSQWELYSDFDGSLFETTNAHALDCMVWIVYR